MSCGERGSLSFRPCFRGPGREEKRVLQVCPAGWHHWHCLPSADARTSGAVSLIMFLFSFPSLVVKKAIMILCLDVHCHQRHVKIKSVLVQVFVCSQIFVLSKKLLRPDFCPFQTCYLNYCIAFATCFDLFLSLCVVCLLCPSPWPTYARITWLLSINRYIGSGALWAIAEGKESGPLELLFCCSLPLCFGVSSKTFRHVVSCVTDDF